MPLLNLARPSLIIGVAAAAVEDSISLADFAVYLLISFDGVLWTPQIMHRRVREITLRISICDGQSKGTLSPISPPNFLLIYFLSNGLIKIIELLLIDILKNGGGSSE